MMYVLHKNDILLYTGIHGNHNPLLGKLTFQMMPHLQVLTDTSAMYSPAHTYTQAARRWHVPITVHIAEYHGTQNIFPYQECNLGEHERAPLSGVIGRNVCLYVPYVML